MGELIGTIQMEMEENGYYVSSKNIEPLIDETVNNNNFDHIYIIIRFGDNLQNKEIPVKDWIGLGYMDYYGIGFSSMLIRRGLIHSRMLV